MSFWSGERLEQVLPGFISDFSKDRIDSASYRLRLGDQVFITADTSVEANPNKPLIHKLTNTDPVSIPPGQFAFLLTLETVKVPADAIAFISIRAGYKFKGLINVSGFHVDPGWNGKLLFGVYNAGPLPIILARQEPLFLIVYASLDRLSNEIYDGQANGRTEIPSALISNMSGQVFSPIFLQRRIHDLTTEIVSLKEKIASWRYLATVVYTMTALFFAIVLSIATWDPAKVLIGGMISDLIQLSQKKTAERCAVINCNLPNYSISAPQTTKSAPTSVTDVTNRVKPSAESTGPGNK